MLRVVLCLLGTLAMLGFGMAKADDRVGEFVVSSKAIMLDGEIGRSTIADFHRALSRLPGAKVLYLHSPGGDVDIALKLAAEVRQRGLSTVIPDGYACYSACSFLFFAGREHVAHGKLGVHRVASKGMRDQDVYDGDVRAALASYGCPKGVIKAMVSTPSSDLHVFSAHEITALAINRRTRNGALASL